MQSRKNMFRGSLLSILLVVSLTSCNKGGPENTSDSGNGGNINDKLLDVSSIQDDLPRDDQGNVVIDENGDIEFNDRVNLNAWCIIGDPDQTVFNQLATKFNNEYAGRVHINITYVGHFDYYNNLEQTYQTDFDASFPDICIMHNEKTAQYANKGYLYCMDTMFDKTGINFDFSQAYSNIDRVSQYQGHRFAIPMDGHGFVTSIRRDIIKKNNLGFDNNTRFIPASRAEYQELLEKLRAKADEGTLLVRNLIKGEDHSWKTVKGSEFYPEYYQSTDPDGLSALYANSGSLVSSDGKTVIFQDNKGFQTYITDQVERYNDRLMGQFGASGAEDFPKGNDVMFSEGPWWVSQTYSLAWNNSELTRAGEKGVSQEDATDPVYAKPYIASRPTNWWTLEENASSENGTKWYGNGHSMSITKHVKTWSQVAAALTFMKWYTQGKDADSGTYHLATWCTSGHVPAWKNVYDSDEYKKELKTNLTLKALGDPADLITMESLANEVTIFNGLSSAVSNVQSALKSSSGCTKEQALEIIKQAADDVQTALDLLG